ncbi:alpha/beta fold hydrolase [Actinoplanes utahensis]|uniref:Hydrolase n=1 Tax=Actinoplanes utahensis TaxID=1869 RepID=A0A0A6UQ34_ACTUT|nr:alpha/beta hydrolase [Actinoplanes utahensis]KHD76479.1 hydrolase [Actinoplanes utahensis]GIF29718.1 hydrolase [Actinoplanes utahensis]
MTHTIEVPGAVIAYDVREPATPSAEPALVLVGSPMDASGFVTLAGHFTDRRVITYDPRGTGRSKRTDPAPESTPVQHADDIRRVIEAAAAGPVDLFASSGGAVNALALVAAHPDLVRVLVAHEPPAVRLLPDHVDAEAAVLGMRDLYQRSGLGPAMVKFIEIVSLKGPIPPGFAGEPGPDPATFGLPTEDDGSRDDVLLGQNLVTCCLYQPDFAALKAATTRIVLGVGAESEGELAHRAGRAVAGRLGLEPTVFPSNHAGFLGGEYGQHGDPTAFADALRRVLAG